MLMPKRLSYQLQEALPSRGPAIKRKQDVHKMAEAVHQTTVSDGSRKGAVGKGHDTVPQGTARATALLESSESLR